MPNTNSTPDNMEWQMVMELFLSQMVFVLEGEGRGGFTADKLTRWLDTCTERMLETGSVPTSTVAALRALQARVLA